MTKPTVGQHEHDQKTMRRLYDARGIYCCMICDECEEEKRANYRPDIFADSNYWHDEPIEEE